MMWRMHEGVGWWMVFGGIWMVIFWAGVIALIVWAVNRLVHRRGHEHGGPWRQDPLEIARTRYARGEITKEQFDQIKKDLSSA